jgi:glucose/arabinose dehydrogenase
MSRLTYIALLLIAGSAACPGSATAQPAPTTGVANSPPFTATLSNSTPLAMGMDVEGTSQALGTPLKYLSGPPGDETYLALRDTGMFNHHDRLYLQFRGGRLAAWRGDWGHNWMWR